MSEPVFMLDTNVFLHASGAKSLNISPTEENNSRTVLSTLISKCYQLLFTSETLEELTNRLSEMQRKNIHLLFDVPAILFSSIINVISDNGKPKGKMVQLNIQNDILKNIIKEIDRFFLYALRDVDEIGRKIFITADSDFFPEEDKDRQILKEFLQKYDISILHTSKAAELTDIVVQNESVNEKGSKTIKEPSKSIKGKTDERLIQ